MIKRFKRLLSLCLVVILSMQPLWAKGYQESSKVSMIDSATKNSRDYPVVNLMLGASDIITDVPGILYPYNGAERTLVPIRVIAESVGAKVGWLQSEQKVTIEYEGKNIQLVIDEDRALVNGSYYALPDGVPAKRMDYDGASRTLVPVRFISEQLGLKVQWVGRTSTVIIHKEQQALTQMLYNGSGAFQEMQFQTTGPVTPTVYTIAPTGNSRIYQLVMDLPNTILKYSDTSKVNKDGKAVLGIFQGDFGKCEAYQVPDQAVPKVRVTLTMDRARGYEVIQEAKGIKLRFVNTIKAFSEDRIQGAKTLVVRTSESPTYNVLTQGSKVIVDILDTKISAEIGGSAVVPVNEGGILTYQYAQMSGSEMYGKDKFYTRLTVNLESESLQNNVYIDDSGDRIYVYVSEHPIGDFFYGKDSTSSALLSLLGQGRVAYESVYLAPQRLLKIQVPESFAYINDFSSTPNDQLVERLDIKRVDGYYHIDVLLSQGAKFVDRGNGTGNGAIEFSFINDSLKETVAQNEQAGKLIVIDAGHGGKDPGAISKIAAANGLKEKDLVLSIALKVKQRLESLGYQVYLTRDYDTYIDLYNRAGIANELGADAFLSIHANSAAASANGVEMLYADDERESLALAVALQSALVKATGARDRGEVVRGNLVVLRETTMPAVLAEVGFISNEAEVKKLMQTDYIQKIVEGLTQGIVNYFVK